MLLIGLGQILMPTQPNSNSGYGIVGQSQFDRSSRVERRSIMNVNVDLCLTTQYSCLESILDGPIHWPIGSRKERKNY